MGGCQSSASGRHIDRMWGVGNNHLAWCVVLSLESRPAGHGYVRLFVGWLLLYVVIDRPGALGAGTACHTSCWPPTPGAVVAAKRLWVVVTYLVFGRNSSAPLLCLELSAHSAFWLAWLLVAGRAVSARTAALSKGHQGKIRRSLMQSTIS